jgi:hypothetical protein
MTPSERYNDVVHHIRAYNHDPTNLLPCPEHGKPCSCVFNPLPSGPFHYVILRCGRFVGRLYGDETTRRFTIEDNAVYSDADAACRRFAELLLPC